MKMLSVTRTESFVRFVHEAKGPTIKANDPDNPGKVKTHESVQEAKVTAHEAPLASFDKALQALADVAANILELGQGYKKGMVVLSLSIGYTKTGLRSATITFTKALDATGKGHRMSTPSFRFDDGQTPEEGRRECSQQHAKAIEKMIAEAVAYAEGERQQALLNFNDDADDGEPAEPSGGDVLDFSGGSPEKPAKKSRKK